jgi:hypothetical protein
MTNSHPPATVATAADRFALLGNPPLMPGEDAAAYHELRERLCAALKPADVVDDIFVNDITFWQWEVMRWRRAKGQLLGSFQRALGSYLAERLRFEQYVDVLKEKLVEAFLDCQPNLTRDECTEMVQQLDPRQPSYDENFQREMAKWFIGTRHHYATIEGNAKAEKAAELACQCSNEGAESLPTFVAMVGATAEEFMVSRLEGFYSSPDSMLERVDQRLAMVENRRDRALRELARHKLVWGEIMRQTLKEIEAEPQLVSLPQQSAPSLAPSDMVA